MALGLAELTVEELFWDASVGHEGYVACPSQLCLAHGSDDAEDVWLLQNLCVGDLCVLPANVKKVPKASEVEAVHLTLVPPVGCPCLAAVEKGGEDDCPVDFQLGLEADSSPISNFFP